MREDIENRIEQIKDGVIPEGYKKTKIGIIPKEWNVVKIKDIASKIGSGKTPTGGDKNYLTEGIMFIRSQNVLDEKLDLIEVAYISEDVEATMSSTRVRPNDILLNITGASIGRCCLVPNGFVGGNLNQHVCIIRVDKEVNRNYIISQIISEKIGKKQIESYQAGGNREGLNFKQIGNLNIIIANRDEQEKIQKINYEFNTALGKIEELIAIKKQTKKWFMQNLLAGKKRLSKFSEEWKTIRLGDCFEEVDIRTITNNEYPVLTSSRKGIFFQSDYFNKSVASNDNTGYKVISFGEFTYRAMSDDGTYTFNIQEICDKGIVSPAYAVFKAKESVAVSKFLYYLMNDHSFNRYLRIMEQGGTRQSLNYDRLCEIKIKIPEYSEQHAIAEVLMTADKEIELLQKKLELIKQEKKAMMQLLLTGIVRVN